MGDVVVIYGTRYGSTQRYAAMLGERLDAPVVPLAEASAETVREHGTVVLATPILAGNFLATKFAARHRALLADRRWAVLVVGMSPVESPERASAVQRAFPDVDAGGVRVFHVRGAIEYASLNAQHRVMMALVNGRMRRAARRDPTPGHLAAAELAGRDVDLVDGAGLDAVVDWVTSG